MFGLFSPVQLRRTAVGAALLTTLTVSGCTSDDGPTAAQAGQTLKTHILQLLKERNADSITVTDPGGKNIPCGEGKAKQTFAATGNDTARKTSPENMRSALLGALDRVAIYKIVNAGPLSNAVHVVNDTTRTQLLLDSPTSGVYQVSGETMCLIL